MSALSIEIAKYMKNFSLQVPIEIQEIMEEAKDRLVSQGISKNALKVGDIAKEFKLPNALGNEVSLYDAIEKNDYVVISFYRGQWCPYCNMELHALQGINDELNTLGAKLIAVSPQSPDASLSTVEKHELAFEVLSDDHNKVAKEYGLVFVLAEELRSIYESFDIDITGLNQEDSYELPMPATYVINKNKEIIYAFVDEDYRKRLEPQDILDAIHNA